MEPKKIKHLGMIMDGNRRWAKERGLQSFQGHQAGYEKIREVLGWCRENGIEILTLYAFSTENWQRAKPEVDFLMKLFYFAFTKDIKELHKNNVRVRVIGRREGLSKKLREAIDEAEQLTEKNVGATLNLAINYGGRPEIIDAFNRILKLRIGTDTDTDKHGIIPQEITEEIISQNIYTAGLPDPDLIVRTSGELRLSGFLMWQAAYSELYFTKKHWPGLTKDDFDGFVTEFANRQRRFGK